jgi:hypothetical protein
MRRIGGHESYRADTKQRSSLVSDRSWSPLYLAGAISAGADGDVVEILL